MRPALNSKVKVKTEVYTDVSILKNILIPLIVILSFLTNNDVTTRQFAPLDQTYKTNGDMQCLLFAVT